MLKEFMGEKIGLDGQNIFSLSLIKITKFIPAVVVNYTFNSSIPEAEAGGSHEFEANLGFMVNSR